MSRIGSTILFLSLSAAMLTGCDMYDAPPAPFIEGAEDGSLDDPNAPIILSFAEPVDPATIDIKLSRATVDLEGNLADEDDDPETNLDVLFSSHPRDGDVGGFAELIERNSKVRIVPSAALPIGPKLAIVVEKGLKDLAGNETTTRKRLSFGYTFKLECNAPSAVFDSGYFFMLADIKQPLKVQVQLWTYLEVDPMTGKVHGQCTNADRNPDPNRCPTPCKSSEVCRLLPAPACVAPSEKAGTVDEYSDYVVNDNPPTGYTFSIDGCVQDQPDGSVVFVTAPTDVVVQSPPVTLRNVTLGASFMKDAAGVLRGSGSLGAGQVLLGTTASGKGEGGLDARKVPTDEAPMDVPLPPMP
jgi:hypothetical protein